MSNNIEIIDVSKSFGDFELKDISFDIPKGRIVGLIGENGAGKSTLIKLILGLLSYEKGKITLFDNDNKNINRRIFENIGVVLDDCSLPENLNVIRIEKVMNKIYSQWSKEIYFELINRMKLPKNKKIKEFSKGIKMKLSIIIALSHCPKLLILDEATSGLDPIIRDEILDLFLDFVQDDGNSILVSSHITSDLEKVADYIAFINNGELQFFESKDELIYNYAVIKCKSGSISFIDEADIISCRKVDYGYQVLVRNKEKMIKKYNEFVVDNVSIDDIMLIYVKGGMK